MNRKTALPYSLLVAVLIGPGSLWAQTRVVVKSIDTDGEEGILKRFSLESGLSLQDRPPLPADQVVRIFTNAAASRPASVAARLDLVNGDRLFGQILSGTEEAVTVRVQPLGNVDVPLRLMSRLTPSAGRLAESKNGVRPKADSASEDADVVWLINGDRLEGIVAEVNQAKALIELEDRAVPVEMSSVLAVRFAQLDAQPVPGLRATLHLIDGSRLTVRELTWSGEKLEAQFARQRVQVPADAILRVDVAGGRWVWLSELEPLSFEHVPAFSLSWPWVRNRNVLGRPMRLGGQTYDRGVGVHAEAVLIYDLAGRYERFVSEVGVDDEAGALADVDIEVRVDGEGRFQRAHLRAGEKARIDLPVEENGRLELIVRFGANADIQDRVNWAGAALIRKPPSTEPSLDPDALPAGERG